MTGWKTKAAAILSVIYGIAGYLLELHDFDGMMNYLITGISLVGVGHKIEKAGEAYSVEKNKDIAELVRDMQRGY